VGRERRNGRRFPAAGEASGCGQSAEEPGAERGRARRGRLAAAAGEGGRERRGSGGPHLAVRGRRGIGARRLGPNGPVSVRVRVFLFSFFFFYFIFKNINKYNFK
jgi:hypothetical protein